MITSEPPADRSGLPAPVSAKAGESRLVRALQICCCSAVMLLAVFQFSENTADPDLWGHVVFGRHMLQTRSIPKTEMYSWTARGQPWVNHECLAEISLGGAHALLGGGGLLLLKVAMGVLTLAISLRLGLSNLSWPARFIPWTFCALAVVEISYGFAARPQIFTALFLVMELFLLRRIHAGSHAWVLAVPVLFAIWINTHGGVLAGFGLLGLAATAATARLIFRGRHVDCINDEKFMPKTVVALWLAVAAAGGALFCNPWKGELIRWLIGSVLWMRPEIEEWNPPPLGWDHAAFFILLAVGVFAWVFTRRPRAWWELAVCAAFSLLALRSARNTPLCGLVFLALASPHLADALARFRQHFARLEAFARQEGFQNLALILLLSGSVGMAVATFVLHKEHPLTMEVPSARYPNGAVAFLREHALRGKLLVFFDWGEMVIFHLPDCPPSLDGRLDTCYSRALIAVHWKFYNGEPFDEGILNPDEADLALLPANLAGAQALAQRPGWKAVYFDDTAVLLVRNLDRFPQLAQLTLPVRGPKATGLGRAAFSDQNPRPGIAPP